MLLSPPPLPPLLLPSSLLLLQVPAAQLNGPPAAVPQCAQQAQREPALVCLGMPGEAADGGARQQHIAACQFFLVGAATDAGY